MSGRYQTYGQNGDKMITDITPDIVTGTIYSQT